MPEVPPPAALTDVAAKVDRRLSEVLEDERRRWREVDPRLVEVVDELARMLDSGGKRLRAAFCYWAWRGAGGNALLGTDGETVDIERSIIDVCTAFEFLQVFALIHDDVMDNSATRRGATTIHRAGADRVVELGWRGEPRRYGEGVAILVGDLAHVYADRLMVGVSPQARQLWDELRIELNLGQYLDMRSAAAGTVDYDTARRVATFKSALYTIVRPLQLGACLQESPDPELLHQLDRFGRPLGRAFQLRDDALGVVGNEGELGKPVGDDLREGKPTELLAHAFATADDDQRDALANVGRMDLTTNEVDELVQVLVATGALAHNEAQINRLIGEARTALSKLTLDQIALDALSNLAEYVAARNR